MAMPDALPFVTGSIGLLGTQASWELMERCDTLLMVGSNFRYAGARSARDERGQADQPATRLLGLSPRLPSAKEWWKGRFGS